MLYLNDQIVALNERVNKIQESTDAKLSGDLNSRFNSVRETQAALVADMDKVKEDMQSLNGRVEENSHLVKRAVERDTTEQDTMKATLAELNQKVSDMDARLTRLYEYLKLEPSAGPRGEPPAKEEREAKATPPPPPAPPPKPVSPETALYDSSLANYREGKYEGAIDGFQEFLKKYPKSDLADNAQFWIGESHTALKQYEQAILAYQQVIKNYPNGNKVPNAMLRQALAFYEIKDKTSSQLLLKKLIRTYPNSSEAKIAEDKLKTLK